MTRKKFVVLCCGGDEKLTKPMKYSKIKELFVLTHTHVKKYTQKKKIPKNGEKILEKSFFYLVPSSGWGCQVPNARSFLIHIVTLQDVRVGADPHDVKTRLTHHYRPSSHPSQQLKRLVAILIALFLFISLSRRPLFNLLNLLNFLLINQVKIFI